MNKGEINMQKLVVDAPDKLEKGERFGPGGVRINGKMKIQYKNPETLEDYLKRKDKTQYTRNINAVCGNEKVDNRITKIVKVFVREFIYEGWRRHGVPTGDCIASQTQSRVSASRRLAGGSNRTAWR